MRGRTEEEWGANAGRVAGGDGKPEARLRPSFLAALPIYILRRIYSRMCTFLISWMHAAFTRARTPMHLARRTFSEARIATFPLVYPSGLRVVLPHPSSHFCTNPRSFIRFPLVVSFCHSNSFFSSSRYLACFPLSFALRVSNISVSFPQASSFPRLLALRDPLKSLSLCFSRY